MKNFSLTVYEEYLTGTLTKRPKRVRYGTNSSIFLANLTGLVGWDLRFVQLGNGMVMVMVMHLYSAFSMWICSNVLYNTLWGTLRDCFMAQFTIFF